MKLSIVIPAFNEEATICNVINKIPEKIPEISQIIVIVVDDGSQDRTPELAHSEGAVVVRHFRNLGVGKAFQTGVVKSLELGVDIMVNMDADGQFDPLDIEKLIQPIVNGKAECVTASRFIDKEFYPEMHPIKFYGNQFMSLLISCLIGRRYYDVSCGFRAYSSYALMNLDIVGEFTYTQESFLNFNFKGLEILEVPIKIKGKRQYGKSRVAANVVSYGFKSLKIILRSFRDYRPFRIFGFMSLLMFMISFVLGCFLLHHYFKTHMLTPHKWAGFTSAFFAMLGCFTFTTGLVADMLDRIRINQERILYFLRQQQQYHNLSRKDDPESRKNN